MSRSPTKLSTERLTLEEMRVQDLDSFEEMLGDPIGMQYYPHPFSRQEAMLWIERNLWRYREHGFGLWAVRLRLTGEFVGDCGLTIQHVEGVEEVEVGWHTMRRHWSRGYATEAGMRCRDHAFQTLGRTRLISLIRPENVASAAVARKLGMHVESETVRSGMRHDVFALKREDLER